MFKNKKIKLSFVPLALSLAAMPILTNFSFKSNKKDNVKISQVRNNKTNIADAMVLFNVLRKDLKWDGNPNLVQDVVQNNLPLNLNFDLAKDQNVVQLSGSLINGIPNINQGGRFQIGSQTKMFTALAVFQLLEKNPAFSVDTKMNEIFEKDYIDKFNTISNKEGNVDFANITIGDLLSHRAGLPDYVDIKNGDEGDDILMPRILALGNDRLQNTDIDDVISIIQNNTNGTAPERGIQSYSNTAYYILGNIIAKISGKSYYDYISKNIFNVLGMDSSSFNYDDVDPWFKNIKTDTPSASFYYSAGGISSSINDMLLWGEAIRIRDNRLMTNESYNNWFLLARTAGDYGAGIYYEGNDLTHGGQTLGYLSKTVIEANAVYTSAINNSDTDNFNPQDLIDNLING